MYVCVCVFVCVYVCVVVCVRVCVCVFRFRFRKHVDECIFGETKVEGCIDTFEVYNFQSTSSQLPFVPVIVHIDVPVMVVMMVAFNTWGLCQQCYVTVDDKHTYIHTYIHIHTYTHTYYTYTHVRLHDMCRCVCGGVFCERLALVLYLHIVIL